MICPGLYFFRFVMWRSSGQRQTFPAPRSAVHTETLQRRKAAAFVSRGTAQELPGRRPNSLKVRVFSNVIHFFHQPEFERACALAARRQLRSLADENFLLHVMGLVFEFVDAGISGALPADKDVSGSH